MKKLSLMKNGLEITKINSNMTTFTEELTDQLIPLKDNAVALHAAQSASLINKPETTEDIMAAVREINDLSERTMINFIMLGALARSIRDNVNTLDGKLEFGFSANALTPEVKSLFKTWGFTETPYGYIYYYTPPIKWDIKIPVEVHIIKRHYKFFEHLDRGFFGVDNFYIANPFESYWKARHLIK